MEININSSDNLNIVQKRIEDTLDKELLNSEINLLEGILKTKGNNFTYKEIVKVQYPILEEEEVEKRAKNYKAYFGKLRQTFQEYYDTEPNLEGFKIKVTKDNFKRLLDTYIFQNSASDLIGIKIDNLFCIVESLSQLQQNCTAIPNLELFCWEIKKIICALEILLEKIETKN